MVYNSKSALSSNYSANLKSSTYIAFSSVSVATLMYSYCHNSLPSSFRNLFLSSNQVHHYETQLASQYRRHFLVEGTLRSTVSFIKDQQSGFRYLLYSPALLLYLFFFNPKIVSLIVVLSLYFYVHTLYSSR